jgi:hypothetical protein
MRIQVQGLDDQKFWNFYCLNKSYLQYTYSYALHEGIPNYRRSLRRCKIFGKAKTQYKTERWIKRREIQERYILRDMIDKDWKKEKNNKKI